MYLYRVVIYVIGEIKEWSFSKPTPLRYLPLLQLQIAVWQDLAITGLACAVNQW